MQPDNRTFSISETRGRPDEDVRSFRVAAQLRDLVYVRDRLPAQLNEAVRKIVERDGSSPKATSTRSTRRMSRPIACRLRRRGRARTWLTEIDQVMEMIDVALGSTAQYGASLEAISADSPTSTSAKAFGKSSRRWSSYAGRAAQTARLRPV
jgi:hypothetical protein